MLILKLQTYNTLYWKKDKTLKNVHEKKKKKSVGFFEQWTHINIKYTHFVNKRL